MNNEARAAQSARQEDFDPMPRPAVGHMPFAGHRTVAEVWADELRVRMMRGGGAGVTLGSHQRCVGKSQVHLTPRWVIGDLGPFDLDPCAATDRPWDCAKRNYVEADDGLSLPWAGLVWLNPPFDRYQVGKWIQKLADHGDGICLVHARTEAEWFQPIWRHADLIFFRSSRLKFCRPDGTVQPANSGAPPVFAAFGQKAVERLRDTTMLGTFIDCARVTMREAA